MFCCICMFFFWCEVTAMIPYPTLNSVERRLSECILNISETYFDRNLPVAIQTPGMWHPRHQWRGSHGETLLKMMSRLNGNPKLTLGFGGDEDTIVKPGSHIFLVPNLNKAGDRQMAVSMLQKTEDHAINPMGHVLIGTTTRIKSENLRALLSFALHRKLFRVVVCIRRKSPIDGFDIFSWLPNEQSNICSMNIDKLLYMDSWISEEGRFLHGSTLFPSESTLNLNNCKINVSPGFVFPLVDQFEGAGGITHIQGVAVDCVYSFCKKVNCTTIWNRNKKTHIQFPVSYGKRLTRGGCELTYPHFRKDFSWFVPSASEIPHWQIIFRVFNMQVWILVIVVIVAGTLTLCLTQRRFADSKTGHSVLLTALLTHLGAGDGNKQSGFLSTHFFAIWLFYCLIINTAYNTALFRLMVYPGKLPQITTLEQLKKSGLEMVRMVQINGDWDEVLEYKECMSENCLDKVIRGESVAVLFPTDLGKRYTSRFRDHRGRPTVVILEQRFGTLLCTFRVESLSCVLHSHLETIIHRVVSSGLVDRWTRQQFQWRPIADDTDESSLRFAFSLFHLQSAFYLLAVGLCLALLSFFAEILTVRCGLHC